MGHSNVIACTPAMYHVCWLSKSPRTTLDTRASAGGRKEPEASHPLTLLRPYRVQIDSRNWAPKKRTILHHANVHSPPKSEE